MSRKVKASKKNGASNKARSLTNNASVRDVVGPRPKRKTSSKKKNGKGASMQHVRAVCAITDPFCPASKNSKYADGTMGNTMTEQFRGNITVSSLTASDKNLIIFSPQLIFGILQGATAAGSVVTMAASFTSYKPNSLLSTHGAVYRIVSFGVVARCVASATTASGLVTFGTSAAVPAAGGSYTTGQELYDEVTVKAIQPGMELSWISVPRGPSARNFVNFSTVSGPLVQSQWTGLFVEITGAPVATAVLSLEWFMNIEFTLNNSDPLTAVATPNPPAVSAATQAVTKIHSSLGSFVEGGVKSVEAAVEKHAKAALSSMMSDPIESIAALLGF